MATVVFILLAAAAATLLAVGLRLAVRKKPRAGIACAAGAVVIVVVTAVIALSSGSEDQFKVSSADGSIGVTVDLPNKSLINGGPYRTCVTIKMPRDTVYATVRAAYPDSELADDTIVISHSGQIYRFAPMPDVPQAYCLAADVVTVPLADDDSLAVAFPVDTVVTVEQGRFETIASASSLAEYFAPFDDAEVSDGGRAVRISSNGGYTLALADDGWVTVTRD